MGNTIAFYRGKWRQQMHKYPTLGDLVDLISNHDAKPRRITGLYYGTRHTAKHDYHEVLVDGTPRVYNVQDWAVKLCA